MCNYVFVTARTVYAYYLLLHVQFTPTICYRMSSVRLKFVNVMLRVRQQIVKSLVNF